MMRRQHDRNGLRDAAVVVTGAGRGIGAALAVSLARAGARVAAVGLEPEGLAATVARCGPGTGARAWTADVTDNGRMQAVAAEVAEHFGRVDAVVANAGIGLGGLFSDGDPAAFSRVIEVNLLGSAATARAFLPALLASRGYYLQVASLAALAPAPLMTAYAASKAGAEAFAHALRGEVAHQGVAVGVAYLSWTDTDMVRAADEDELLARIRAGLPGPAGRTAPLEHGRAAPGGRDRPPGAAGVRPALGPYRGVAAARAAAVDDGPAGLPGDRPAGRGPAGRGRPAALAAGPGRPRGHAAGVSGLIRRPGAGRRQARPAWPARCAATFPGRRRGGAGPSGSRPSRPGLPGRE